MMLDPMIWTILGCALATYVTRFSGYLIISQFGRIHHRLEAALDAVPTAVLAALVAPYLVTHSLAETVAIIVAGLVAMRFSLTTYVAAGLVVLVTLRLVL